MKNWTLKYSPHFGYRLKENDEYEIFRNNESAIIYFVVKIYFYSYVTNVCTQFSWIHSIVNNER